MVDPSRRPEEGQRYIERTYRDFSQKRRWVAFSAVSKETDLYIKADQDLSEPALHAVRRCREEIEGYIAGRPIFQSSLVPLDPDPLAPGIVQDMLRASSLTSVGPMAAVAGAIAEQVGTELRAFSKETIVENGGDIYLALESPVVVGLFAGSSPLSMRIGIRVPPDLTPCGICTSSGTVGPSLSFGKADSVTVWASSTALADAAATCLGNRVSSPQDIEPTLDRAQEIPGIRAVVIILGGRIGMWGPLDLVRLESSKN